MRLRIVIGVVIIALAGLIMFLFWPLTQQARGIRIQVPVHMPVEWVGQQLKEKGILSNPSGFIYTARVLGCKMVRPGSYLIPAGENMYTLTKRFRNGRQTAIQLILGNERIRLRTPLQFASKMQRYAYTSSDSTSWITFLRSEELLASMGVDTNTVMTRLLPLTYEIYWTDSPAQVYRTFAKAWDRFWSSERKRKAQSIGLNPTDVYILASIVEEETQYAPDRPLIASTYLNRLRIGMRLQADPTAKFGSGDFTANRVTAVHLRQPSPYNTYIHTGLPPGSICLPSIASIDAVLNAPPTDYLYFVASHLFDGTSSFSSNYQEHQKKAKRYQEELSRRLKTKTSVSP